MSGRAQALRLAGWAAIAGAVAYFCSSAGLGLTRIEFGDETEKFVAALMQREGARLYRDVHTQHGPLSYVLPHALVAWLGPVTGLRASRVAVALLAVISAAALAASPALPRRGARALAAATFLGGLAPLWLLQSLNLGLYHNLAGCLAAVMLAQLTLPLVAGAAVGRGAAFASGLAAGLIPFAAYSHGPAVVLFALASLAGALAGPAETAPGARSGTLLTSHGGGVFRAPARPSALGIAFVGGALVAAALMVVWLARFGDLRWYAVYHFAFNQRVYSRFIGFHWSLPLESLRLVLAPELAARTFCVVAAGLGLGVVTVRGLRAPRSGLRLLAAALVALGLLMLNPRGGFGFAANALVVAALAVAAFGVALLAAPAGSPRASARGRAAAPLAAFAIAAGVVAGSEVVSRVAVSSPNAMRRSQLRGHRATFKPAQRPLQELVRSMADPHERVQAFVYRPHFYLETGRLPAAAQYYFLPWQAAYEQDPVPGFGTDLCRELRERAPPVVLFDDWLVWDQYRFTEYAPCIAKLLEERYVPVALDPELRILRERLVARWRPTLELVPATRSARDALAPELRGLQPVRIERLGSNPASPGPPGTCLAAPNGRLPARGPAAEEGEPGSDVVALASCEDPRARWHALDVGEGAFVLVGGAGALCLSARGRSVAPGAALALASCFGAEPERLTVEAGVRGDSLRLLRSGLCAVPAPGGAVEQRPCTDEDGPWRVRAGDR